MGDPSQFPFDREGSKKKVCIQTRASFAQFNNRRVYLFVKQTRHVLSTRLSNRCVFKEGLTIFEQTLLSQQTDTNFPRNSYLVLEHIQIFQETLLCASNRYSFFRKPYLVLKQILFSRRHL